MLVDYLSSFFAAPEHSRLNIPCEVCSWTSERQDHCNYHSHVKIFYEAGDRGVWSLGSQQILKERSGSPPTFEANNIQFLKQKTSIPVPTIVADWEEDNGRYFMITKRIHGQTLEAAWPIMSTDEKERVAKETAEYLLQLRSLQSPQMQSLNGQPLYSAFLFQNDYGISHGPLSSDDELWKEMEKALEKVPEKARQRLQKRMPPASPFTFTHGDLTNVNIIVKDGHLAGIIDWEVSGFYPVWWEFTCAGIGLSEEDWEWKTLLQKNIPDYTEAYKFWMDFRLLCQYPTLDDAGQMLLEDLLQD